MKESLFTENLRQSAGMRVFLYLFILLVCSLIGTAIIDLMKSGSDLMLKIAQGIGSTMIFIVPPIAHYYITRKVRPMKALGLKGVNQPWPLYIVIGVILMFVSLPVTNQLTTWNESMDFSSKLGELLKEMEDTAHATTERLLKVDSFGGLLLNLLIVALIPAIGEELTFRGVLQQALTRGCKNAHVAILLSAVIFSFIHFQFFGFLPRMFLGILLGYMFYVSGSLWTNITMHFVNNGTAVVLYYLNHKGVIDVDVDHFGALQNGWLIGLSAIVTVVLIFWGWVQKKRLLQ